MRRKLQWRFCSAIVIVQTLIINVQTKNVVTTERNNKDDPIDNMIDFDDFDIKFDRQYSQHWNDRDDINKELHRYSIVNKVTLDYTEKPLRIAAKPKATAPMESTTEDMSVIPLELISTTENPLIDLLESTTEPDLTVIPLSTTKRALKDIITETVTLPTSTENELSTTDIPDEISTTANVDTTTIRIRKNKTITTTLAPRTKTNKRNKTRTANRRIKNKTEEYKKKIDADSKEENVPIFTVLDFDESLEVPEDYYDTKDVIPTRAPSNDALSVIFGLAGSVVESVVESVAEKVVPRGIYDLFKRMQKQNEALEAERLRSREENGGLGQFGRGILKTISTGLTKPFNQLMAGVKDIGSLDNDRSFVAGVVSGVTNVANVANSLADNFKDRVQAIYPGTLWCGDGHVAQARSGDLGLFFFTDTCCRQHDACKIYIRAGDTKYGLTNTGLFTRSHCSCDKQFRECLQKTKSLVSGQIGLTYFNVLGPQCFRKAHPIVKCLRRTRITGQKCEEYELDYTKPKMWQWFDNETY